MRTQAAWASRPRNSSRSWMACSLWVLTILLAAGHAGLGCSTNGENGPTTPDTTPPVITSGPVVVAITTTTARVEWETDEPATSIVRYGLSTAYGLEAGTSSAWTTTHAVDLTDLTPDTVYHFLVESSDPSGNTVMSDDDTFATPDVPDTTPPVITSGPAVVEITMTTARVEWETDEPATSIVLYGLSTAYGLEAGTSSAWTTTHAVDLADLTPDTVYHFLVESSDPSGNTVVSDDDTFATAPPIDWLAVGWEAFETSDYAGARTAFREALLAEPSSGEGYLGLSWALLYSDSLLTSVTSAESAITNGCSRPQDAWCCAAIAQHMLLSFDDARSAAEEALDLEPEYLFPRRATIDYLDLHLIRAEAAFHAGEYEVAQESLDMIDPGNNLDPAGPATWIVDGRSYGSYVEALLALIERATRLVSDTRP